MKQQRMNKISAVKKSSLGSAAVGLMLATLAALACISDTTEVCVGANTMVAQSTATITCHSGGVTMTLPSFVLYLAADCNVPWTCATTGPGYWDYAEVTNATCTAPVNKWDYQSDCSAVITPGAGTVTLGPCRSRTPSSDPTCPSMDPPVDPECMAFHEIEPKNTSASLYALQSVPAMEKLSVFLR